MERHGIINTVVTTKLRIMTSDKLASFRIDNALWEEFKKVATQNNTTATALLIGFIQEVVNTQSIQSATSTDALDLEDLVKKLIAQSISEGDIGEAIGASYATTMAQMNQLKDEVQELKSTLSKPTPPPQDTPQESPIGEKSPIEKLGLSTPIQVALKRTRINTVGDLLRKFDSLLLVSGIGLSRLQEIEDALISFGFDPNARQH